MEVNSEIPFEQLSRRWVKILMIAFESMKSHGHSPEKFNIKVGIDMDISNSFPIYYILFYPHEEHWMHVGEKGGKDYTVVINANNLEFIKIYRGRN